MAGEGLNSAPFRLLASSVLFSVGLFSLLFSFPLLATSYGFSYEFIGFLGVVLASPFILVAGIYTKLDFKFLRPGTVFSYVGSIVTAILLLFRNEVVFISIYVISSVIRAFWWITSEISIAFLKGEGNAEKYSTGWGVPNAVVPIFAGYIVQYFGFNVVFIVSAVSFTLGLFFIPKYDLKPVVTKYSRIKLRYVISLLFAGISMGFIFFVIVPVLKHYEISYSVIGIIVGIFGASSAAGYVLLNFVKVKSVKFYAVLSSLLVFPTFVFGIDHNVLLVAALMVTMGFGTAVAMSKILSYVSSSASVRLGVFYYETIFAIGSIVGSYGGATLIQYVGDSSIVFIFALPLVYIAALLIYDRRHREDVPSISGVS